VTLLSHAIVRHVEPSDVDRVAALLAGSVHPAASGLVPYHAPGFARFLAASLAPPPGRRTVLPRTLGDGTVADWRVASRSLVLHGLCGDGARLLADGLALATALGRSSVTVHVGSDDRAVTLYRGAGFVTSGEESWVDVPLRGGPGGGLRVVDWPRFAATRDAYGFADLTVAAADGTAHCVQVSGAALRVGPALRGHPGLAALADLVGARRAWTVVAGPAPHPFATFLRMTRTTSCASGPRSFSVSPRSPGSGSGLRAFAFGPWR
jgi:hypothetical protein